MRARRLTMLKAMRARDSRLTRDGKTSPLGHFVLGGVMMRRGEAADAERELNKGLALEARLAKRAR